MPDIRDAGVVAVVAAAGGLAMGLAKLGASGWLARGVFAGLKGWQVLNAGAFAINIASVSVPGRVDGEMAADAQRAARAAKTAATADTADTPAGIPRDHWSRGLFSPAGRRSPSGASSSSARPSSPPRRPSPTSTPTPPPPTPPCPPGGPPRVAYRLCGASRSAPGLDPPVASGSAARSSPRNPSPRRRARSTTRRRPRVPLSAYFCCHLPLSLHFGWITAATVLSLSSFVSPLQARRRERRSPPRAPAWVSRRGYRRHGHLGRPRVRADARVGARGGGGGWREIRHGDYRRVSPGERLARRREGGEIARRRRGARRVREGVLRGKRGEEGGATIRVEIEA